MADETFFKGLARTVEYYKNKPMEERSICITGGEPTLHPNFKEFVNKSIISGMHVHILSNFTFNDDIQSFLKKKMKHLSFLVNINDPTGAKFNGMNPFLWERTMKNLEALQCDKIELSLNVWNPMLSYDHIFDVLEKFPNVAKRVRVGIFNPIVTQLSETVFE
jgi:MoaA/NifB/PqqE/SkfB family radical SAM enzyme